MTLTKKIVATVALVLGTTVAGTAPALADTHISVTPQDTHISVTPQDTHIS
ncbi:hypothetical protein [Streptomyces caelestis]|uniref:Lipoprotein n=1 Tax=Streptomyces caelestis TaxID=36816 RepID=A0A7W9H4E5_9ACTN|nr:hypothetical protein [Streptomyces caelestis]MBB5795498.1 hypothetical protein [Streptomyces caelestis]GGW60400.1 hypothetical protein GCM10010320_46760 [Streptomyces caelestis]